MKTTIVLVGMTTAIMLATKQPDNWLALLVIYVCCIGMALK